MTLQGVESGERSTSNGGAVIMWQYAPVHPGIVCHLAGVFWMGVCVCTCVIPGVSTFLLLFANELTEQVKSNSNIRDDWDFLYAKCKLSNWGLKCTMTFCLLSLSIQYIKLTKKKINKQIHVSVHYPIAFFLPFLVKAEPQKPLIRVC